MLLSLQDMVSDQNSDLQKLGIPENSDENVRKSREFSDFAAKQQDSLGILLFCGRKTVGITPIILKHASWHVIQQSGQARARDLDGFQ